MWQKKQAKAMAGDATKAPGHNSSRDNGEDARAMSASPAPAAGEKEKAASAGAAGAQQQTTTVRQADLALGQIIAVLMRSAAHKHYSLADLEWLVLPAVLSGQYRIAQAKQSGVAAPIGVVLWASVSADVDQRLSDLSIPARLRPDEWRSGDVPWLMELVCDARLQPALLKDLGETTFKGRAIKMRVRGADGKMQVGTMKAAAEAKRAG
jgi:hemolysin-activating ACP:hemolysin acyltransferase